MTSFATNEEGDVVVENGLITLAQDGELLRQKTRALLSSIKGEWWLDESEGLDHMVILTKHPNEGRIRDEVRRALLLLDEQLALSSFLVQREGREMTLRFTAEHQGREVFSLDVAYG